MITEYNDYCLICGRPKDNMHHIFKGQKQRALADEDELIIPLCLEHHTTGALSVHHTKELNVLCEIIGQLAWEKHFIADKRELPFENIEESAREAFRTRYSRSYL